MILKNKGLSNGRTSSISSNFKTALITGAVYTAVLGVGVAAFLALTNQGKNTTDITPGMGEMDKNYNYVVDNNTDVVYLKYDASVGNYTKTGLSVAFTIDEETGQARVMTKADLEEMMENKEFDPSKKER